MWLLKNGHILMLRWQEGSELKKKKKTAYDLLLFHVIPPK